MLVGCLITSYFMNNKKVSYFENVMEVVETNVLLDMTLSYLLLLI